MNYHRRTITVIHVEKSHINGGHRNTILVVRDRLNALSRVREPATPQRLNIGSPTFSLSDTTHNHPLRSFSWMLHPRRTSCYVLRTPSCWTKRQGGWYMRDSSSPFGHDRKSIHRSHGTMDRECACAF